MVSLNNPYPPIRPRPAAFIPMGLLFMLGYGVFTYNVFSFLYRYALMVALLVVAASMFDRELLSKARLATLPGRNVKWGVCLGLLAVTVALLFASAKLQSRPALVLDFYRSGPIVSRAEPLVVVLLLIVPFEEIFFRAYGQLNLMNLLGRSPGLILASALYGLFFLLGGGWVLAMKFTLLNLYFGYIYYRTGALPVVIAFRIVFTLLILFIPL